MARKSTGLRLALAVAAVLVAGCDPSAPDAPDSAPSVEPRGPAVGPHNSRVWDGGVRFEATTVECHDSNLEGVKDPPGKWCAVSLAILNESEDDILLPTTGHTMTAAGQEFGTWDDAMKRARANPDSVFTTAIPPGGGGAARIYFTLPEPAKPERVQVHAAEGSSGATITLDACRFRRYRGTATGACYSDLGPGAEVGERYPYAIGRTGGEIQPQYVCFDLREWTADPQPTAQPLSFIGQGVLELVSENRAVYTDNSGFVLPLGLTEQNEENPGTCG
ncbi:MAG TPA: hypothetical protein VG318_17840 [Actinomycetota bacterium]|nr:hypothetical protein [Actinomycetota bacterium]